MTIQFARYIGIDYSGAQTPTSSLKGLRIYASDATSLPTEVPAKPSPRKYWTRKEIAEWLVDELSKEQPTIVGIDHAFSFPREYFEKYAPPHHWPSFLQDFQQHWPTDGTNTYVDFVRDGKCGAGSLRCGNPRWRRLTEKHARTAKSVFHFDVQGSVAKSTHAGIPWLLYVRQHLEQSVHFWPFDGWTPPSNRSVIVEVYPALWNKMFSSGERTADQQDAFAISEWMRRSDADGTLVTFFHPELEPEDRAAAEIEGWILGVV